MRVSVVGAGAIGGTVGAYLARSGTAVKVVDKDAAHATAMAEKGLTVPLTDRLVTMIHELEDGVRERTVANADELELVRRSIAAAS